MPIPLPKTVCVTGAGGFIGSHVLRRFSHWAEKLSALLGPPDVVCIEPHSSIRSVRGQIDDLDTLLPLIDGADVVIHLAGPPSVAASFRNPINYVQVHTVGTASVLEACRRVGVSRVIYISSAEVYGLPELMGPVDEGARMQARSPYAAAKIGAECLVEAHTLLTSTTAVILRPFSIYGPGASPHSLVPTILQQACTASCIELFDPEVIRDYCYVEDVVEAIENACRIEVSDFYDVYNIGSGVGMRAADLAQLALEIVGRTIPIQVATGNDRPRNADIRSLIANPHKAQEGLTWQASTNVRTGLEQTLKEF